LKYLAEDLEQRLLFVFKEKEAEMASERASGELSLQLHHVVFLTQSSQVHMDIFSMQQSRWL